MLLRVQSGPVFPVLKRHSDGSYASEVVPRRGRNKRRNAIPVRVIECWLTVGSRTVRYRFVTDLLDPAHAPALELARLYAMRWEIEGSFAEFKGQLRERTTALRAHHPPSLARPKSPLSA